MSHILVVDDEEAVCWALKKALTQEGHSVAVAASAEEALDVIPLCSPDVVLMDIQLPGLSGIECIRQLKSMSPNLEIMMLTVLEDHERIFQSLAAGAGGYLIKKTSPVRLLEAIDELHKGGAPMSCQIARQIVEAFQDPQTRENASPDPDRKSTRLNSSHGKLSRMPSSA